MGSADSLWSFNLNQRSPSPSQLFLLAAIAQKLGIPKTSVMRTRAGVTHALLQEVDGEAELLQAAALFEQAIGLGRSVPLNPRPGTVPSD